jgi:hypothetical protein
MRSSRQARLLQSLLFIEVLKQLAACLNTTAILPDGKICVYDNSKYRAIVNEPSFEEQTKIVDGWCVQRGCLNWAWIILLISKVFIH